MFKFVLFVLFFIFIGFVVFFFIGVVVYEFIIFGNDCVEEVVFVVSFVFFLLEEFIVF